jgi:hypothetical protein
MEQLYPQFSNYIYSNLLLDHTESLHTKLGGIVFHWNLILVVPNAAEAGIVIVPVTGLLLK